MKISIKPSVLFFLALLGACATGPEKGPKDYKDVPGSFLTFKELDSSHAVADLTLAYFGENYRAYHLSGEGLSIVPGAHTANGCEGEGCQWTEHFILTFTHQTYDHISKFGLEAIARTHGYNHSINIAPEDVQFAAHPFAEKFSLTHVHPFP